MLRAKELGGERTTAGGRLWWAFSRLCLAFETGEKGRGVVELLTRVGP